MEMAWYSECLDELEETINQLIEEAKDYFDALALEGYKISIESCLRDLHIGQMLLKWNGRTDLDKLEKARERYHTIRNELNKIAGKHVKMEKLDKLFEFPIVAISTDIDTVKEISKSLLKV
ncbi:MAG: hypothetical protein J7L45_03515 [Candidatus Aenigmarchaeota archaeon]|nr:hypothetical protein [Candidatus Aenigmarchaeota archaeon]